jgi:hypothetical protein
MCLLKPCFKIFAHCTACFNQHWWSLCVYKLCVKTAVLPFRGSDIRCAVPFMHSCIPWCCVALSVVLCVYTMSVVCNVQMEEQILEVAEGQSAVSTRCLAARTGTSHDSAHHTLQEQQLCPYHIQSVQGLIPHDALARCGIHSVSWFLQLPKTPAFTAKVLYVDELFLDRTGVTNIYSEHVWSN